MKFRGLSYLLLIVALQMAPRLCGAYETDQFTNRLNPIADSTAVLDEQVNLAIAEAIADWKGRRNDWKVVTAIYNDIGGHHWVDKIERWAMNSEEVERLQPSRYDSIYRGHPLWATRVAALFGVGPTIKVNNQLIGSDKLGHFLSQGRKFYRRYLKYQDEAKAAEHSAYTERALFGQSTTGVYSNADLVANYEGFLFYRSLFEDNIIAGKPAILLWTGEDWEIQRSFTWADHVNEYWDEALNVNHFDNLLYPHMKERMEQFCPDYFEAPEAWDVENEAYLQERYKNIQLRDTSELRLSNLCVAPAAGEGFTTAAPVGQSN
ncbi:MAG: hypothetical protein OES53_05040 [Xanthomonadales bacterium]|nr:hypothetical protein [Xanthomonadales bacterium]MDH3924377.1 hypothetical protein [Xanthomonadales bacterium]